MSVWVGRTHNKQEQETQSLGKYECADEQITHNKTVDIYSRLVWNKEYR